MLLVTVLVGCASKTPAPEALPDSPAAVPADDARLGRIATSDRRWTGIAAFDDLRLVVNYPRWSDDVPVSVAVLDPGEAPRPFPDADWNDWAAGDEVDNHWVCVQSVVRDPQGGLWVLDPGNPKFEGVIEGAPKLVKFASPDAVSPERIIAFEAPAITPDSYLNDVRFDLDFGLAYLTDSGDGALVVVDLLTKRARRVLDGHPSTQAEPITLTIGGLPFDRAVHADGIALDAEGGSLFYQPLTGRTLYRLPLSVLRDGADDEAVAAAVEAVAEVGASDGLLFHQDRVWLTSLEHDAIRTLDPATGVIETVVQNASYAWPDSLAVSPGGRVVFTTAQIHLGDAPLAPFGIWAAR
ncbi:MAG: L-dopachrome tautomerase-related protein [Myxococcota bacterium]